MDTIRAFLSNGILFPLKKIEPAKLKDNTIHIEIIGKENLSKKEKEEQLEKIISELQKSNPFEGIIDPVEWQKKIREDRELPD